VKRWREPASTGNRRDAKLIILAVERKGANLNDHILTAIDEEIPRLRQARVAPARSGRPPGSKNHTTPAAAIVTHTKLRRKLSAKARQAIADAQRTGWAKAKSRKKAATSSSAGKKPPTAKQKYA
jgi:hypothetical protein